MIDSIMLNRFLKICFQCLGVGGLELDSLIEKVGSCEWAPPPTVNFVSLSLLLSLSSP